MTPLCIASRQEFSSKSPILKFAVGKSNPYIVGREISLFEALKCVVYQTKWAASHTILDRSSKEKLDIWITLDSETVVPGVGVFVAAIIDHEDKKFTVQFIVTQSTTTWFFLYYSPLVIAQHIDLDFSDQLIKPVFL